MIGGVSEQRTNYQVQVPEEEKDWSFPHSDSQESLIEEEEFRIPPDVEKKAQYECHKRGKSWHTDPTSPQSPISSKLQIVPQK